MARWDSRRQRRQHNPQDHDGVGCTDASHLGPGCCWCAKAINVFSASRRVSPSNCCSFSVSSILVHPPHIRSDPEKPMLQAYRIEISVRLQVTRGYVNNQSAILHISHSILCFRYVWPNWNLILLLVSARLSYRYTLVVSLPSLWVLFPWCHDLLFLGELLFLWFVCSRHV